MSQLTQTQENLSVNTSKNNQIIASAALGIIILLVVGFTPIEVIHNATHDVRHSSGFPCH